MKLLFWGAVLLVAYTYLGYIAWLWLRARLSPWPVLRSQQEPYVSIVMIVRNEERWLESKLRNLLQIEYSPERCQIVVVSDGSTDRSDAILRRHAADPRVQVLMNQLSRGKASGLNDAIPLTTGDVVVLTDARQKIEPGAIRLLMENFADPEVGCVSGALMLGDPESGEAPRQQRMKIGKVDEHRGDVLQKAAVNPLAHFLLAVGLETDHFDAEFFTQSLQARVDLVQRNRPVLDGVPLAEHVVVDAMEHQHFHHDSSSIRQRMLRSTVCPDFAACTIASVIRRLARPSRAVTSGSTSPRTTAPKCSN